MTRTITMSHIGNHGRWGNQVIQAGWLDCYARRHGAQLQLPPWAGDVLCGIHRPAIQECLPTYREPSEGHWRLTHPILPEGDEAIGHDYLGWCQHRTNWYTPDERTHIRRMFTPAEETAERLQGAVDRMAETNATWVGLHYRAGDQGREIFPITPMRYYLAKLRALWPRLTNPRLFIATEDYSIIEDCAHYKPLTAEALGVTFHVDPLDHYCYLQYDRQHREPWQMDFFVDWFLLSQCDIILAPNSTFSFTAAMMNPRCRLYRWELPDQHFHATDPWNAWPLLRHDVAEYPHVPGIALQENPRW
jgi:hypothetical protein